MDTILVVEDNSNLASLYVEELEEEGYEVLSVPDVNEAVCVAKQTRPDLVVMEVQLRNSNLNCVQLIHKLRSALPHPAIIVNTSLSAGHSNEYPLANAWVQKSSDLTELKTRVRECLQKSGMCPKPEPNRRAFQLI